ncbi:hypothetical protein ACTFIR_006198 [Dictyostelium discoideum]
MDNRSPNGIKNNINLLVYILLLFLMSIVVSSTSDFNNSQDFYIPTPILKERLKSDVKRMFYHGYDNYIKYSFPKDELNPISCSGTNTFGDYALTFIDSLDTLVVLGDLKEFERAIKWVSENIRFDKNLTVSVFETNIRVLGGLLSAHLLAEEHLQPNSYDGSLLPLAKDLGDRLLKAFETPTGIPYGAVNLKYGVPSGEIAITSTASATTFSLEFGILSRLTNDRRYDDAARKAVRSIWKYRSDLELVGNHINIINGEWTIKEAGIGTGVDSFYEYLYKSAIYFDDDEYLSLFEKNYKLINKYIKKDPWYVDVSIDRASIVWPIYNSLQSFWPGIQSMYGDYENAFSTIKSFHIVWRRYGFIPEGYNLLSGNVQPGQKGYPLRPELAESLYHMYQTNKDPVFIRMAKDLVWTISNVTTTKCGHANILDVESHQLDDRMESFFLSETCKYLFLLFNSIDNYNGTDIHSDSTTYSNPNPIDIENSIFNTEGHIFPMQSRFFKKYTTNTNDIFDINLIKKENNNNNILKDNKNNNNNNKEKDIIKNNNNNNNQNNKNNKNNNEEDNFSGNKINDNVNDNEKKEVVKVNNNNNKNNNNNNLLLSYDSTLEKSNWTCEPLPFLRRISSGTFQFIGGPQDTEWFEDKKIRDAMFDLTT